MTLKVLATQLECQAVDHGYVQRFDWETWILNSFLMGDLEYETVKENTKRTKSLVLYLLQEYCRVVETVEAFEEHIEILEGDIDELEKKELEK